MDTAGLAAPASASRSLREACETFLFLEAELLDEWRLDEWYALFASDGRYEIPAANSDDAVDPGKTLFYVADDYARLGHRVERLNKETAYAEFPRSRVARLVSNVRILAERDDEIDLRSVFVTYRSRNETTDTYIGHHLHTLRIDGDSFRIVRKRSLLDILSLRPQGSVSLIL